MAGIHLFILEYVKKRCEDSNAVHCTILILSNLGDSNKIKYLQNTQNCMRDIAIELAFNKVAVERSYGRRRQPPNLPTPEVKLPVALDLPPPKNWS